MNWRHGQMGLKMVLVEQEIGATPKLQIATRVTLDVLMQTVRSATSTVCVIVFAEQLGATVPLFALPLTLDLKDVEGFKYSANNYKYKKILEIKKKKQILIGLINQNKNQRFNFLGGRVENETKAKNIYFNLLVYIMFLYIHVVSNKIFCSSTCQL